MFVDNVISFLKKQMSYLYQNKSELFQDIRTTQSGFGFATLCKKNKEIDEYDKWKQKELDSSTIPGNKWPGMTKLAFYIFLVCFYLGLN